MGSEMCIRDSNNASIDTASNTFIYSHIWKRRQDPHVYQHHSTTSFLYKQNTFMFDYKTQAWVDSIDANVGKYSLSWVTAGDESVELLNYVLPHHQVRQQFSYISLPRPPIYDLRPTFSDSLSSVTQIRAHIADTHENKTKRRGSYPRRSRLERFNAVPVRETCRS